MILETLKFTEEYGRGFEREHEVCVSADDDIKDGEKVYVTLYLITRHYGGLEEGGWWYNWHKNGASRHCTQKKISQRSSRDTALRSKRW